MSENFANTYQTTLNNGGTLGSGDVSMIVTSATGAPDVNFRVKIESELILVTAKAGTTFTIVRGIEGTTAASHADGSTVTHVLTAVGLVQATRRLPELIPVAPNTLDDEFDDLSIDGKWTTVNNPAGGDAFSESKFPGYLWVGLPELGATDNTTTAVRIYQTPPTGTQTFDIVMRCALSIDTAADAADGGEFCSINLYLADSANNGLVTAGYYYNIGSIPSPLFITMMNLTTTTYADTGATSSTNLIRPTEFVYIKLSKTTSAAYTSANTYLMSFSHNGIIWQDRTSFSKTFTANCDQIGILLRPPKSVATSPHGAAAIDFFRRTA